MLQVEEEKLNKAYDAAYAHIQKQEYIPPKGREEWKRDLDKARYNWVSFRDAECGVILYQWWGSMGGGPGNAILACEVQMTIDRQSVIEKFVSK
ncbi:MAG: DUF1311 domain-containing protein [Proteobacteria bacterium]|nr:DUF1311 domain-containing protein [Pseudomonadota bacterium]